MDERIGISLHLSTTADALESSLRLRSGDVLSVRVLEGLGKNLYSVSIRGTRLTIRSNVALASGTLLRVKAVVSGKRIELRILESPTEPGALAGREPAALVGRSVGGSAAEAAVLLQAMRRSGLPVAPESMAAISAMVPPSRRKEVGIVRLATIFFDKHLHVDPEQLEALYLSIGGRGESGSRGGLAGGGSQSGSHSSGQSDGGQAGGSGPGSGGNSGDGLAGGSGNSLDQGAPRGDVGGENLQGRRQRQSASPVGGDGPEAEIADGHVQGDSPVERAMAGMLRDLVQPGEAAADGWPALFNHLRGSHDGWLVVPFRLEGEGGAVDGSIRLLVEPGAPDAVPRGATLKVSRGVVVAGGVGAFEITGSPPGRLTIHADSVPSQSKILRLLPELREKLRNLGVEIDDTINGGAGFDGFTAETFEIRGVDATA